MGDNRDHSQDSRYWGFVDRDAIMGRLLDYWSVEAKSSDYGGDTTFLVTIDRHSSDAGASAVSNAMGPDAPYGALGFHFLH